MMKNKRSIQKYLETKGFQRIDKPIGLHMHIGSLELHLRETIEEELLINFKKVTPMLDEEFFDIIKEVYKIHRM